MPHVISSPMCINCSYARAQGRGQHGQALAAPRHRWCTAGTCSPSAHAPSPTHPAASARLDIIPASRKRTPFWSSSAVSKSSVASGTKTRSPGRACKPRAKRAEATLFQIKLWTACRNMVRMPLARVLNAPSKSLQAIQSRQRRHDCVQAGRAQLDSLIGRLRWRAAQMSKQVPLVVSVRWHGLEGGIRHPVLREDSTGLSDVVPIVWALLQASSRQLAHREKRTCSRHR